MEFRLSSEQEAWRDEVRDFLRENVTDELRDEGKGGELSLSVNQGPATMAFRRKVVEKGWFGLNWPKEYGGLEKTATEQLIMMEEFDHAGAPNLSLTLTSLGPAIYPVWHRCEQEGSGCRRLFMAMSSWPLDIRNPIPEPILPASRLALYWMVMSGSSMVRRFGIRVATFPRMNGSLSVPTPMRRSTRGFR